MNHSEAQRIELHMRRQNRFMSTGYDVSRQEMMGWSFFDSFRSKIPFKILLSDLIEQQHRMKLDCLSYFFFVLASLSLCFYAYLCTCGSFFCHLFASSFFSLFGLVWIYQLKIIILNANTKFYDDLYNIS